MKNSIEAVIFDMDGLMLDTERISQMAWQKAGTDLNIELPISLSRQVIGLVMSDIKVLFKDRLGADFPLDRFLKRANKHYHRMLREEPVPVKPGVFDLLDYLEEWDIPTGVATSTGKKLARQKLSSAGLLDRFRFIVAGDEVEKGKPEPEIFLRVAELLSVAPAKCLVLEDSEMGIRGAHAAGMTVYMIPDLIEPTDAIRHLAHGIFESLQVLLEQFRGGGPDGPDFMFPPVTAVEDSPI